MPVVCIIALKCIDQTSLLGLYTSHILMFKKKMKKKERRAFSRLSDSVKRPSAELYVGCHGVSMDFYRLGWCNFPLQVTVTSAERILSRSACLMKRGPPRDIFLFLFEREREREDRKGKSGIFLQWTLDKRGMYIYCHLH